MAQSYQYQAFCSRACSSGLRLAIPPSTSVMRPLHAVPGRHWSGPFHCPRARSTSLSMSVRSVMMPSTPRSRRAFISIGSSIVHTCTWTPAACARRTSPRETTSSATAAVGHLQRHRPPAGEPPGQPGAGGEHEGDHLERVGRGGDPASRAPAERVHPAAGERPDQHPVPRLALLDEPRERLDRALGLEVDVEPRAGEGVEELGQGRHPLAPADQRLLHLGVRRVRDAAGAVGHPVQDGVVEGQQHPVAGDVDVGLEVGVAQLDRVGERRERVLEALDLRVVGAAAVGEGQRASGVEVGRSSRVRWFHARSMGVSGTVGGWRA